MTSGKLLFLIILVLVLQLILSCGWKATVRAGYESAEYRVIDSDGPFEIREYPNLMMATTPTAAAASGDNASFMRLFRYISGANSDEQKIAMTTPVFMQPNVGQAAGQMGFVMPKKIAAGTIPQPVDDNVAIRERLGGRFAVIRFAGRLNKTSAEKAEQKLRQWIEDRGLTSVGKAESAGYDPPWTPGPMRRNEVLIRLQASD